MHGVWNRLQLFQLPPAEQLYWGLQLRHRSLRDWVRKPKNRTPNAPGILSGPKAVLPRPVAVTTGQGETRFFGSAIWCYFLVICFRYGNFLFGSK